MARRDRARAAVLDPEEERFVEGLDALELGGSAGARGARRGRRVWGGLWPKLAALVLVAAVWQAVVWMGWRPDYVLPSPLAVLRRLLGEVAGGSLLRATGVTLRRAAAGYAVALVLGTMLGLVVARQRLLRAAVGSLLSGLQSMPSIAWFPLAIMLFSLSEAAILAVVVLGAAPAIANGVIASVDHVPPLLLRAGRMIGARGLREYRHVVFPAALPGYVAGLKQGWAFAWRSLMAGELLVVIATSTSLGQQLQYAREFSDAEGLVAVMLVILVVGIVVDAVVFGRLERAILARRGLVDSGG